MSWTNIYHICYVANLKKLDVESKIYFYHQIVLTAFRFQIVGLNEVKFAYSNLNNIGEHLIDCRNCKYFNSWFVSNEDGPTLS